MRAIPLGFEVFGMLVVAVSLMRFLASTGGFLFNLFILSTGVAIFAIGWFLGTKME